MASKSLFEWLFKEPLRSFNEGDLGFSHWPRTELVLIALALICVGAWWYYRRETRVRVGRRLALAGLRVMGVSAILFALAGPVLLLHKNDETTGVVAIAIDVSKSMTVSDVPRVANPKRPADYMDRLSAAKAQLASALKELEDAGLETRVFAIGNSARLVADEDLTAGDDNTRLSQSQKDIVQSGGRRPVSDLIILSDGRETTTGNSANPGATAGWAHDRGTTVHAVGFGAKEGGEDVEVVEVHAPNTVDRGSLTQIRVAVRRGTITDPLKLTLFDGEKAVKENIEVPQASGAGIVTMKIPYVPTELGPRSMSVSIPPLPRETNKANNAKTFQMNVRDTRVEVLIVEGSPRHEFAFVRRAMSDNRYFRLVSLLRINPNGLPLRIYKSATDDSMFGSDFPTSDEELGRFKAIILSDIEAGYFKPEQIEMIKRFVVERGGGLCMLGGMNSMNLGGYGGTEIEKLLPVSFEGTTVDQPKFDESEFAFEVTKDGLEHEILRLVPDDAENKLAWSTLQSDKASLLKGYNPLFKAKQAALVLARGGNTVNGEKPILLAVQNVGAGRTAVFTPASSWRWKMRRPSTDDTYRRFWTQMIRWLAVGAKEMLDISTDTEMVSPHQPVVITAHVLDRAHRPYSKAKVTASITRDKVFKEAVAVPMPWNLREEGVYQMTFTPDETGTYAIEVSAEVPGEDKPVVITKETSVLAIESSVEFEKPQMDAEALTAIASQGGGTVDLKGSVSSAVKAILTSKENRRKQLDLREVHELHDAPALLLLIACVWFGEWVIRKRSGLA